MSPTYRCEACGNKTRFDITETKRVKAFHHFSLAGDDAVESEEVLERQIERIECRWCGSTEVTEESDRTGEPVGDSAHGSGG